MELSILEKLLPLLSTHRVTSYRNAGVEILFDLYPKINPSTGPLPLASSEVPTAPGIPVDPNEFKANELMDFDKVLNWSSPDTGPGGLIDSATGV